jgi:hypothetical protein
VIPDLETLFTDPRYWGVETATPVQRAACRIIDGRPLGELANDADVRWMVGGDDALAILAPGGPAPKQISIYGAVRIGKSDLAACLAFRASQTIDMGPARPHEVPRIPIVNLTKDLGDVTFGHLIGRLRKPALRPLLVGEGPDWVTVRHPSGSIVEIAVAAGARAGGSLISRWIGGAVFDEKPRMLGADEAVVNYPDALHAVEGRLLPGAQVIDLGSPWAPWGPAWDDVQQRWGRPTRHHVVLRVTGPMANPLWWTPIRIADLGERNPRALKTDAFGEFSDSVMSALPSEQVDAAFRSPGPHHPLSHPIGVLDSSAGRGDAFTWAVGQWAVKANIAEYETEEVIENGVRLSVLLTYPDGTYKRKNSSPPAPFLHVYGWGAVEGKFRESLPFDALVARIARHFRSHAVRRVVGDQYQAYPLQAEFQKHGIIYQSMTWDQGAKIEGLSRAKNLFRDKTIIIEAGPDAAKVRAELVQLQEKPTSAGGVSIGARRGGHDDRAALIINFGILDSLEGAFHGSPIERDRRMYTGYGIRTYT